MKRFMTKSSFIKASMLVSSQNNLQILPSYPLARMASNRFLDIYQLGSKAAIEKERARIADEMSRGYFADMAEMKKHGGKIAMANKVIIPAMVAVKFPDLEVIDKDGMTSKLPFRQSGNLNAGQATVPKASLLGLSFRASSQAMINSWSLPFIEAFSKSENVHVCEVSFIDSWLLRRSPIKRMLLWYIRKSNLVESKDTLQKKTVYSFGDHYYFRKELKILNLLTGYIFLLDKFGRIRWQGFGMATEDELASLFSCTSALLNEESEILEMTSSVRRDFYEHFFCDLNDVYLLEMLDTVQSSKEQQLKNVRIISKLNQIKALFNLRLQDNKPETYVGSMCTPSSMRENFD